MNDNQMVIHSRGCTILWAKFGVITVFHCFQKFVSHLGTFFQLCTNKIPMEFALRMNTKTCIPNLGHLLLSLLSMKGISIGN